MPVVPLSQIHFGPLSSVKTSSYSYKNMQVLVYPITDLLSPLVLCSELLAKVRIITLHCLQCSLRGSRLAPNHLSHAHGRKGSIRLNDGRVLPNIVTSRTKDWNSA